MVVGIVAGLAGVVMVYQKISQAMNFTQTTGRIEAIEFRCVSKYGTFSQKVGQCSDLAQTEKAQDIRMMRAFKVRYQSPADQQLHTTMIVAPMKKIREAAAWQIGQEVNLLAHDEETEMVRVSTD
jgi:hypothetical protein